MAASLSAVPPSSEARRFLRRFLRRRSGVIGAAILVMWLFLGLFAPLIGPFSPLQQNLRERLSPPSAVHLFGTDEVGRDIFSRVLYGARISLPVALMVVALSGTLGIALGAVAGFVGGWTDEIIMRLADATLAFPALILAMAITTALGPGLFNAALAMTLVLWPEYARLMRGEVLRIREMEYVTAARALGASPGRLLLRHIVPNAIPLMLVKASLDAGNAILLASALSFVGLGATPPSPEWGAMISMGRQKFFEWWVAAFPGLAIFSTVMGFNFLGDALRDLVDPRLRN
ncbi:MAG: ABC transporter permease [Anaerolineales bacterium]